MRNICFMLLASMALLLAVSVTHAAPADGKTSPNGTAPALEFEYDELDWGLVTQGDVVSAEFHGRNAGSAPLVIDKIKTSCSRCTAINLGSNTVKPGEPVKIGAQVDTAGLKGVASYSIFLGTNDPRNPAYVLKLRFKVQPEIEITPNLINYAKPIARADSLTTFTIRGMLQRLSKLSAETDNNALFDVQILKRTLLDNSKTLKDSRRNTEKKSPGAADDKICEYAVSCRLKPNVPAGVFRGTLKFVSDNKKNPVIYVPISGEVASAVTLEPRELFFDVKKGMTLVERQALLKTSDPNFTITGINSTIQGLSCKSAPVQGGHLIMFTLDANAAPKFIEGVATVLTNSPECKSLEISIKGLKL